MDANLHAQKSFPGILFFPGFWSELGMCSEPAAFGAVSCFSDNEFPHVKKNILSTDDMDRITKPNPKTDGLCPLITNRLFLNRKKIEDSGHMIRFSVSRGPLNIATHLMGVTEFLTCMMTEPEKTHRLLKIITEFLTEWHDLQKKLFDSIDGILLLDDIIGFMGEAEFVEFGLPYFKVLYDRKLTVKFLHNDADCLQSLKYLPEMGVNLFNMGFDVPLNMLKTTLSNKVTLLGNLPPRDVLANGSEMDVKQGVMEIFRSLEDKKHVILSCGGGMPPGVSTTNINAFYNAVMSYG
jgi:uroporphyrinogen decarboxylase